MNWCLKPNLAISANFRSFFFVASLVRIGLNLLNYLNLVMLFIMILEEI